MKIYLILIMLLVVACSSSKNSLKNSLTNFTGYKVYNIDSVKNIYIIYARDNKSLPYKILSRKDNTSNGELIKLNNAYPFILEEVWSKKADLVNGTYYYDTPISVDGDSITSLHAAKNLRGLKFIR
ncbi:hypothetical protein GWR56_13070 [Mucilaginibacter sp. 14171R-50]|uniref:hypothetical protein n=1 Tax=Mucilaginibacter sp. 14171R-50 TaxID=2703789 RepID=UPI00138CBCB7|nr:hypothetical protein [Mucilaginibacter sp. 14171R-50]QHS56422.1 hypothetical protein GWR56_13070 [Mucilaginibacter sp. 14171R-50]